MAPRSSPTATGSSGTHLARQDRLKRQGVAALLLRPVTGRDLLERKSTAVVVGLRWSTSDGLAAA